MRAICEICGEPYAEVSINGRDGSDGTPRIAPLRYPLTGAMFGAIDPFHNPVPPFDASLEWEFFRHYGIHRPMIADDRVLTHKGMVRVPKDGGKAFMDADAKSDVDRSSISDRVIPVSDEEAERQVREKLIPGNTYKVTADVPAPFAWVENVIIDDVSVTDEAGKEVLPPAGGAFKPEEVRGNEIKTPLEFPCPECGKSFSDERKLKGHMGGAHKPAKKGKR